MFGRARSLIDSGETHYALEPLLQNYSMISFNIIVAFEQNKYLMT
jgi:hypothetical protein